MYFNYLKESGSEGARVRQQFRDIGPSDSEATFRAIESEYHNLMLLAERAHEQLAPVKAMGALRKAMATADRYPLRVSPISVDSDTPEDRMKENAANIMKAWREVFVEGRPPPSDGAPSQLPRDVVFIYNRLVDPRPPLTATEGRKLFKEYLLMEHLRLSNKYMGAYLGGLNLVKNLRMPSETLTCFKQPPPTPGAVAEDASLRRSKLRAAMSRHPGLQGRLTSPGELPSHIPTSTSTNQPPPPSNNNNKPQHPFFNNFGATKPSTPVAPTTTTGVSAQHAPHQQQQPPPPAWGNISTTPSTSTYHHHTSTLLAQPSPSTSSSSGGLGGGPSTGITLIGSGAAPTPSAATTAPNSYKFGRTADAPPPPNRGYPAAQDGGQYGGHHNNHNDPPAPPQQQASGFISARDQLSIDVKAGRAHPSSLAQNNNNANNAANNRRLGLRRPPFTPPLAQPPGGGVGMDKVMSATVQGSKSGEDDEGTIPAFLLNEDGSVPHQLEGLDPKLIVQVANEILDRKGTKVDWDDIAGLEHAKQSIEEAIVWPLRRPDLFVGLRDPPRGLLLFGPPGTGKTMIARAIASRAQCTFMNISASSLMSKWIGDGEKLVRCLFAVAAVRQPTVIFIDEVDSLLSARTEGEQDAMRRIKTEFLVHMDGVATDSKERVLLIGATNRPEELDEAARRRLEKRLYIPLPDEASRRTLVQRLISSYDHSLTEEDFDRIGRVTTQYSGADVKLLCREAAMGPLRSCTKKLMANKGANEGGGEDAGAPPPPGSDTSSTTDIVNLSSSMIRPIVVKDFKAAMKMCRPSVGPSELLRYEAWNNQYGSFNSTATAAAEESDSSSSAWGDE